MQTVEFAMTAALGVSRQIRFLLKLNWGLICRDRGDFEVFSVEFNSVGVRLTRNCRGAIYTARGFVDIQRNFVIFRYKII